MRRLYYLFINNLQLYASRVMLINDIDNTITHYLIMFNIIHYVDKGDL